MTSHAPLGPSSAARWMSCTASQGLIEQHFPEGVLESESVHAREGTIAHGIAAHELSRILGVAHNQVDDYDDLLDEAESYGFDADSMRTYASWYAQYVGLICDQHEHSLALLETRMDTRIPDVWGTPDAVVRAGADLYIVDFKYGRGHVVPATDNPQLMLYAYAAMIYTDELLELVSDEYPRVEQVHMTIYQPRTPGAAADEAVIRIDQLLEFIDTVRERVDEIDRDEGVFRPGELECRWCPVAALCRPRAEYYSQLDFGVPANTMSAQEIADVLAMASGVVQWVKDVQAYALKAIHEEGKTIPDWKVVKNPGRRVIADQDLAIKRLMSRKHRKRDITKTVLLPFGSLQKLVGGKNALDDILGDAVSTTAGSLVVAPSSDARQEQVRVTANDDFDPEGNK